MVPCAAENTLYTRHTLFIHMEDDLFLRWGALKAWARDEALLAPLGFHRGLIRTEYAHWDGALMAFDQAAHTDVSSDDSAVLSVATLTSSNSSQAPRPSVMAHFVSLNNSYSGGIWLASRHQVEEWMHNSRFLGPDFEAGEEMSREDAAWNLYKIEGKQFQKGRSGTLSSLVVPYDPHTLQIPMDATVEHITNNYCSDQPPAYGAQGLFSKIRFEDVLV